ncbi:MAG: DUF1570 domain-containing protein [Planctomycetota bacterium]
MNQVLKAAVVIVPILLVLLLLHACTGRDGRRWESKLQGYDPRAQLVEDSAELVVVASDPKWGRAAGRHALAYKRFLAARYGDLLGKGRDRRLLFLAFSTTEQMQRYHTDKTGDRTHPGGFHDPSRGAIFLSVESSISTIRHETVHLLMSESDRRDMRLSPWLIEGIPEAFSRVDPARPKIGPGIPETDREWVRTTYRRQRLDLHRLLTIEDYEVFWRDPERNYRDARSLVAFLLRTRPETFAEYLGYERRSETGRAKAFRELFRTADPRFGNELNAFLTEK